MFTRFTRIPPEFIYNRFLIKRKARSESGPGNSFATKLPTVFSVPLKSTKKGVIIVLRRN